MPTPPLKISRAPAEIRQWIVRELARAMNVDESTINPAAPLESLGADSLAAISMTSKLSEWLNCDLPATLMWEYATINAIADGLGGGTDAPLPSGTIKWHPQGSRPPLFLFPGVHGHPVIFASLAAALGEQQPCYGLSVPGLCAGETPRTTVEDIARFMLDNIRRIQPAGPYQLAGYSFGGLLAYEAAQQLVAAGQTVSLVAIYDTFTPTGRTFRPLWQRLALHTISLATRPDRTEYFRARVETLIDKLKKKYRPAPAPPLPPEPTPQAPTAPTVDIRYLNEQAAINYRPRPYPGWVLWFRASKVETNSFKMMPCGGWEALATGGVRVVDIPGTHVTILEPANSSPAAKALRAFLADGPT